jgi:hypothetical protein
MNSIIIDGEIMYIYNVENVVIKDLVLLDSDIDYETKTMYLNQEENRWYKVVQFGRNKFSKYKTK